MAAAPVYKQGLVGDRDDGEFAGPERNLRMDVPRNHVGFRERHRHGAVRDGARLQACRDPLREQLLRSRPGRDIPPRATTGRSSRSTRSRRTAKASLEPYVSYLRVRGPDLVFVAGTDASGRSFLEEARRQNLNTSYMGGDGWTPLAVDTAMAEGIFVGAPFSSQDPRSEAQQFVRAYRRTLSRGPRRQRGARVRRDDAAGCCDRKSRSRRAPRFVSISLASRSRSRTRGVTGTIAFRPSGDVIGRGIVMTRVRNGALTVERAGAGS